MSHYTFTTSMRVTKARLSRHLGNTPRRIIEFLGVFCLAAGLGLFALGSHLGLSLAGVAVMLLVLYLWLRHDINELGQAPIHSTTQLDQLLPAHLAADYREGLSPAQFWDHLLGTYETQFLILRFGLKPEQIAAAMAGWQGDYDAVWAGAEAIAEANQQTTLTTADVVCALFKLVPALDNLLTANKLTQEDLAEGAYWLARLDAYNHAKRPIYGGIARDWASGFTPLLARFGSNLSQQVEYAGKYIRTEERTSQLDGLVTGLDSANGSVVLVGEAGIGKTALLLGLADRLLQGQASGSLAHHQIISLNASLILSSAKGPGDIEEIVLSLLNEAIHAGNIVVALDEAQLFFGQGTGAVNLSQVLLPVLQARNLKLVLAITPGDWQKLRATNTAMASLLTPLVLTEPDQTGVMRLLADRALLIERGKITTWDALLEAYRLSGRYFQDEAYPGRALKVLEAALNYPDGQFVTRTSVERAIESQFGVKVSQASSTESDVLLHLEDKIHERMINQTRAVSVVASALRRARAGVSNPRRPIGSFLFLGPTGVGKTELAKSLAALYFGSEHSVIRLDMSEYQQIADVDRVLASAAENPSGFLSQVRQTPFSVVLFDEIEKAHPNILNLFLQLLDEGDLSDTAGHQVSFKDAIIIATSNAGADEIRQRIEAGQALEAFEAEFTNNLISSGAFKPELLNRFDEIVLFRPLNQAELAQVVKLMVTEVNKTLEPQKIRVELTDDAVTALVTAGYDPRLGARPMRRMVTRRVEDAVAGKILRGEAKPGDTISLGIDELNAQASNQA